MDGSLRPVDGGRMVRRYLTDGDRAAFDQLYSTHAPRLHWRLRSKWGLPDHAAQDALQETFLQGAQAMHKIEDADKVGAWLTTIADRQAMATRRRGSDSTWPEVLAGAPVDLESHVGSAPTVDHATAVVDDMVIRAALDELPDDVKEAVHLYHIEGLTLGEVGHVLGCSASRAHSLLSVARGRLTTKLSALQSFRGAKPQQIQLSAPYRQAMNRLSPRRREVLERHVYRQMKPVEIAAELNISSGCARVHLHLAYKELATLLGIADYKTVINLLKSSRQPR